MSSATGLFIGAHALAARKWGDEWLMQEADARLAIGAANNVLRHYPLQATQLALDWAMLTLALGTLYVPRYERWSSRRQREARGPAPISPINQGQGNGVVDVFGNPAAALPAEPAGLYVVQPDYTDPAA